MTAILAFPRLLAADPRQRARCARTGRFVAWSRAKALRSVAAPKVVVLLPAPVVVEQDAPQAVVPVAVRTVTASAAAVAALASHVIARGSDAVATAAAAGAAAVTTAATVATVAAVALGQVTRSTGRRVAGLVGSAARRLSASARLVGSAARRVGGLLRSALRLVAGRGEEGTV